MLVEQEPEPSVATPARGRRVLTEPRPQALVPQCPLPPDGLRYRLKNKLLGPPLHTEQLAEERLGKPTALAVFASDNLSSSAYATEEMLRVLVPIVGLGAFALVVPITTALLVVLFFLILSYRQTIKAYPTAGGAYMVTRDNFGLLPAQVAGVALLTDYVLTVSVSVAAGTAALASAFSIFTPWIMPIAILFVIVIAYGNLRGVRESGKLFAAPTYFFILNMALLIGVGVFKAFHGGLAQADYHGVHGLMPFGKKGDGLLVGAGLAVVLHSFASGGAAVTGVEAISNGVPAFRKPEWKNARTTLVVMGSLLGLMFLGLSIMDSKMHVAPFENGTPTVISQIGHLAYGSSVLGHILYYCLQAGTMLILVLAANTSFADFPRLASFHAGDNFMPRQLTKRGHRLVFSNGIIFLAVFAIALLIITDAKVDRLIPLYAIGVFTSFTLSQAGMARHHIREKEDGWRAGLFINGFGAFLSLVVDLVILRFKFKPEHTWIGAWIILVFVPIMVFFLVRLAKQYQREDEALEHEVPQAVAVPVRRRLVVMVFVDRLDLAVARAMQFGRALRPDDLRAVHFVIDQGHADKLAEDWRAHGLATIGLELIDCPDRRLTRSAVTAVAHELDSGDAEVCVLLPERMYNGVWHRILHDQTAESIAREIQRLPHANVTTVPFHFDEPADVAPDREPARAVHTSVNGRAPRSSIVLAEGPEVSDEHTTPIADVRWRQRVRVHGRVQALRVEPMAGSPTMECTLVDETGGVSIVFFGRRHIDGVEIGAVLTATGMAIEHRGRLAIVNPVYELR
ncbi:MAG TPA: amino acid permease [Acidimicrobiia bacterium]|nr:amino acid permease [Acidimicrobiia bacterium]